MHQEENPTITIKVIARHSDACQKQHPDWGPDDNDCTCWKYLYIYENGKDTLISAKTRSLDLAQRLARDQWDLRDPVKQKQREIEEREAAKLAASAAAQAPKTLTIKEATDRWLNAQKGGTAGTLSNRCTAMKRILLWAKDNNIETVADVTYDLLDKWRGEWKPDAKERYNRLGLGAQNTFQNFLKSVFRHATENGYLRENPAARLKHIKEDSKPAQPLSEAQFETLLAAIEPFFASRTGAGSYQLAAEFDALFSFERHSGLRLGDAVAFPRSGLVGNQISLTTQKTGAVIRDRFIPDDVAAKLTALSQDRPGFRKGYFFWFAGASTPESLTSSWKHQIGEFSNVLQFTNEAGEPMRFHSHMLRDTFAVELLLLGVTLEDVSRLLTHDSVVTTEKYYAPWVKARWERLDRELIAALRAMGMTVTTDYTGARLQSNSASVSLSGERLCVDHAAESEAMFTYAHTDKLQCLAPCVLPVLPWSNGEIDHRPFKKLMGMLQHGNLQLSEGRLILQLNPAANS